MSQFPWLIGPATIVLRQQCLIMVNQFLPRSRLAAENALNRINNPLDVNVTHRGK